jgi:hypothetical protein
LICGIRVRRVAQPANGPLEGEVKAFLGYRFEEIIDGCDFERAESILVVRGNEDDRRHALCSNGMDHREAVGPRHLYVKKYEIRFLITNKSDRLSSVSRFRD